jgi:hypothetical protein
MTTPEAGETKEEPEMPVTAAVIPYAVSRLLVAVAVGALCTAGASAGAATVLTGSPSPSVWIATYERSAECHQASANQDPRCSVAAAQAAAEQRLADSLESKAKALAAQHDRASSDAPNQQAAPAAVPDPAPVAVAPAPAAAPPAGDDSSAGHDD